MINLYAEFPETYRPPARPTVTASRWFVWLGLLAVALVFAAVLGLAVVTAANTPPAPSRPSTPATAPARVPVPPDIERGL